jgi:hypothetical protein
MGQLTSDLQELIQLAKDNQCEVADMIQMVRCNALIRATESLDVIGQGIAELVEIGKRELLSRSDMKRVADRILVASNALVTNLVPVKDQIPRPDDWPDTGCTS